MARTTSLAFRPAFAAAVSWASPLDLDALSLVVLQADAQVAAVAQVGRQARPGRASIGASRR